MSKSKREKRKEEKLKKKAIKNKPILAKKPLWLAVALVLSFIAYSKIYDNQPLNYDDDVYVTENRPLQNLDVDALFSESYMNQYSPLAMSIMGMEFKLFDGDLSMVRLFSVLLHLGCVALVFLIFRRITYDDFTAGLIALLFGVHPMQVESVAWLAASMKIGSYSLFFLASIYSYLKYTENPDRKRPLFFSFLWFVASCLCKEQAVVLPLTLMAVDYVKDRTVFSRKVLMEKVPFLVVSLIFGFITLSASDQLESAQVVYNFGFAERVLFATYSMGMYLFKSILPFDLSFFYTYPIQGQIPGYYYLFPLVLAGVLYGLYQAIKKEKKWLAFGILFFLINIALPMFIAILSVRDVVMADRYIYIPLIGLMYILVHYLALRKDKSAFDLRYLALGLAAIFTVIALNRVEIFKDSITVFTEVIKKESYKDKLNPYLALPYNNRGIVYKQAKQFDKALADYEVAIKSNAAYSSAYLNRGNIAFDAGRDDDALKDYNKVLELDKKNAKAYSSRGSIYARKGQYDKAIQDLSQAIALDKYFLNAYSNRSLTYLEMQEFDKAMQDCTSILNLNPGKHDILELRGYIASKKGDYDSAIRDYNAAIAMAPGAGNYYFNRSVAYNAKGNKSQALSDAQKAKSLGFNVDPGYLQSLK